MDRHRRLRRDSQQNAHPRLAACRTAHGARRAPIGVRPLPIAPGRRIPAGQAAGHLARRPRCMAVVERPVDGVLVRRSHRGRCRRGIDIERRHGVHLARILAIRPRALEDHRGLRTRLPRRIPRVRPPAHGEPRPVAPVAGRREANGHRVPQRRPKIRLHASIRPMVCRWIHQLLLLGPVHRRIVRAPYRHRSRHRLQPRRANVLCPYRRMRLLHRL